VSAARDDPFAAMEEAAGRQAAEERAARALAAARVRLVLGRDARSAFFATLALRLAPEPAWEVDTLATDGRTLQYHPRFVTGLSPDELVGVVAHEVMHCALAHPARRQGRDPGKWNIACDLAINPLLLHGGFVLPPSRLMPGEGRYAGLEPGKSAEEYFAALPGPDRPPGGPAGGPAESGPGPPADPGGCGRVFDPGRGGPADGRQVEADWQVAVAQAGRAAAGRGPLPAGLGRVAREVPHPPADWRAVLADFVSAHARNDHSWVRPNRRFVAQGLYLPGLHSEELRDVVLAVDTSGSIGEKLLGAFAAEANAVLAAYACAVTVLYHDTEVQKVQTWHSADGPLVLDPAGGGGTSHACVFEWLDRAGLAPACVVCLTDLETEFPPAPPAVPVLWAVAGRAPAPPPFGRVVSLSS
jgi:predicted metal-dependent peptidase